MVGLTLALVAVACQRPSREVAYPEVSEPSRAQPAVIVELPGAEPEPEPARASVVADDGVSLAIEALPEEGGSDEWDEAVSEILLASYDNDGSGWIDSPGEIEAVPCATFWSMHVAVERVRGTEVAVLYGIDPDYIWVGSALGFSEDMRKTLEMAMRACDLPFDKPL
ncbi:hypothetical protein PPSIR1_02673 [Plesiocystis pacifica SIR-1]|uniref:Uncharacterized protein n=1 Tax=Plesiocystis pacifica SIR-1 TaxID=391625 RepID=A6GKF1_9BACT|nr:hypothetical protein PPSIR1_02673 [Plesiocystis pacifica SIR-1]